MPKIIKALLVVNLIFALGLGVTFVGGKIRSMTQAEAKADGDAMKIGKNLESAGIMPLATYRRISKINSNIAKHHAASDAEVRELIRIASDRDRANASDKRAYWAFPGLYGLKQFSSAQRQDLLNFCVAEFNHTAKAQRMENGFCASISLTSVLKDKRVLPSLIPLATSKNPGVAMWSRKAIALLQSSKG